MLYSCHSDWKHSNLRAWSCCPVVIFRISLIRNGDRIPTHEQMVIQEYVDKVGLWSRGALTICLNWQVGSACSASIGHFRVHYSLYFKARQSAKPLLWRSVFIQIEIRTNYRNKNSALRLALKERLMRTRKWPILLNHERCSCGTKRLIFQVQSKFGQKQLSVQQHYLCVKFADWQIRPVWEPLGIHNSHLLLAEDQSFPTL